MSKKIEIQEGEDTTTVSKETGGTVEQPDDEEKNGGIKSKEDSKEATAEELIQQKKAAEQKASESYDRLLRVSAEFENYKKRTTREMRETVKYANERLIKEFLVVVDNLERAIDSATANYGPDDPLVQGVNLTLSETLKILERHKVTPIEALGNAFDPNFHQAMMQEIDTSQPPNSVVRELQKGYTIHDRLLRPSLVAVSTPGKNDDGQAQP
ncbi:MAG: nucleotide exchange factor GrpE [Desulfatitalea sp.]|nr:nucleotide exchange factor GrpE [Desulfatitalea sp.]NNJ99580.1 nucleotide exchange factor GrpE [Desulfatitalea sp.]